MYPDRTLRLAALALPPQPPAATQAASSPLFQRADSVQISSEAQALLAAEQAQSGG